MKIWNQMSQPQISQLRLASIARTWPVVTQLAASPWQWYPFCVPSTSARNFPLNKSDNMTQTTITIKLHHEKHTVGLFRAADPAPRYTHVRGMGHRHSWHWWNRYGHCSANQLAIKARTAVGAKRTRVASKAGILLKVRTTRIREQNEKQRQKQKETEIDREE